MLNVQAWGQTIKFTEATAKLAVPGNTVKNKKGETVSAYGHGVIMADINNDGKPDIYISNAVRYANKLAETLYVSTPTGFKEEDGLRKISDNYGWTGSHGIIFVDYDNDGDYDIYNATTDDRNRLYQNDGNGYYTDVTDAAQLPLIRMIFPQFDSAPYGYGTRGVVAFDADNDGYMDLLGVNWGPAEKRYDEATAILVPPQPNEFYRNNGNGTFSAVDNALTQPPNHSYMGTQSAVAGDLDGDGDVDVLIVNRNYTGVTESGQVIRDFNPNYQIPNRLLINDGQGNFTDQTQARNIFDPWNDANGATLADFDNDGDLDIFIPPTSSNPGLLKVYRNNGMGYFGDISKQVNVKQWGFSTFLIDVDNDGDLDIIAPKTREYTRLYLNDGKGGFSEKPNVGLELYNYDPRGGAVGDIDGDGDLDFYIADANKDLKPDLGNRLFRNDLGSSNRWLRITGRGPKGDMGGFGTKIWVFDKGYWGDMTHLVGYREVMNAYGYLCQDDPVQHFGLGPRDSVDIKVKMLDGTTLAMLSAPAKTQLFFTKPNQVTILSGDRQTASINTELSQALRVQVRDSFGNLVYGAKVVYTANDPAGQFFPSAKVYTGRDGTAQVRYRLGSMASQSITAYCEEAPANSAVFSVTGSGSLNAQLTVVSGDQQIGYINQLLPEPLKVKMTTLDGAPLSGRTVAFRVVSGSAAFEPAATAVTDGAGIASVNVRMGAAAGTVTIYAEAAQAQNSPLVFTAQAQIALVTVIKQAGDGQTGTVGERLPQEIVVRTERVTGGVSPNTAVTFSVVSGGGSIDGQATKTVLSDGQGLAKIFWTLGTIAGLQTMTASAGGATVNLNATAIADKPQQMRASGGGGQAVTPGETFAAPFAVTIQDRFGNPTPNVDVLFQVTQGGGLLDGVPQKTVMTTADGVAAVRWTADPYLGAPNTLQASLNIDGAPIVNSPVIWRYPAADISAARSTVTATSPVLADGSANSTVNVTLRNSANELLGAGYTVELTASGRDNQWFYVNQKTDAGSMVRANLSSTFPEQKIISAKVLGLDLTLASQPVVEFESARQTPDKMHLVSGNGQIGVVGAALPEPFVVQVMDIAGRPMRNFDVEFRVAAGEGNFDGQNSRIVSTSGDGLATARLTLGRTAGIRTYVQVRAADVSNSPLTLYADSRPGEARQFVILSGNHQVGAPNSTLPQPLTVRAADLYNNPIAGLAVLFRINAGDCSFDNLAQKTVFTDSSGQAAVTVRLGAALGQSIVEAKTDFASVSFVVTATDNRPIPDLQRSTLTCTSPVPADGNSRAEVVVTLVDGSGKKAAGYGVRIVAIGEAVQVAQPDSLTDPEGQVRAYLTSTAVGAKIVLAYLRPENTVLEQRGLVEFRMGKPQLTLLSGDRQTGIVGKPCPQPLRVRVTSEDYALKGQTVMFSVLSGGGHFSGSTTASVTTDGEGVAEITFVMGTAAGENRVSAALSAQNQSAVFTLIGKPDVAALLTKEAGDNQNAALRAPLPKNLTVAARDVHNNPVPGTSVFFEALDGGTVLTPQPVPADSSGRAEASVALAAREGNYTFKASLADGAWVLFTATATDNNRAPVVISFEPSTLNVPFRYGDRLFFEIMQVFDADNDLLGYQWFLNGRLVGNQAKLALYMSSSFPPTNSVRCVVSDGLSSAEVNWTLSVMTGVELTAFSAQRVKGKGVQLSWQTGEHHGRFTVYRSISEHGRYQRINPEDIAGSGNCQFVDDAELPPGVYFYKLEWSDVAGNSVWFGPISVTVAAPEQLTLHQNYPNPFNPTTTISFELPLSGFVRLAVFNNTGQQVCTLLEREMTAGVHTAVWNAESDEGEKAPSGLYFVTLEFGGQKVTRKLTLLK